MSDNNYELQNIRKPENLSFKSLMEFARFGYMWTNIKTRKIIASHIVYQMLELKPYSELITTGSWLKYVHPKDQWKVLHAEEKLLEDSKPCSLEYRLITKTGKHIFVNHHMQLSMSQDHELKIISLLDDITEQKSADVILEIMNEGFFELDRDFNFLRINVKAEQYWQVEKKDVINKCIWDIFPALKDSNFHKLLTKAIYEMQSTRRDVTDPVNDHWLHVSATPHRNGVFVIFYDIQNEKENERKIKELNTSLTTKNRELESLTSELKTFNAIAANDYSETLKHLYTSLEFIVTNDARNLSNAGRANIRRAQSSIQKMKLLTDDIVHYTKIFAPSDEKTGVEINDILKTVQQDLQKIIQETDTKIDCADCPVIPGYPSLLNLLFHHLIYNAIKFRKEDTPPFIRITSETMKEGSSGHIQSLARMQYQRISVTDNGIGFNMVDAEKIFAMFSGLHEKGKYKGSGIGLAVCKKVMDIHEGFIAAESEPGIGSTFHCYFPPQSER